MKDTADRTIGNPLSWLGHRLVGASAHVSESAQAVGGGEDARPVPREALATLTQADLRDALRAGWEDLLSSRADALVLCLLYPILGAVLVYAALTQSLMPLIFPLLTGFVLVGPLAALGLYEMSRQREAGRPVRWTSAFDVALSPSFGAIVVLGLYLAAVMFVWLLTARLIFAVTMGPELPASLGAFATQALTTPAGWAMGVVGIAVGAAFAALVLATSVVSFPLLLDRKVGVPNAVVTSLRVTAKNPRVILTWGAIVAGILFLGALPALVGLAVALPLLGHASWHLYRRAIPRA
ncbi:hypothetical protein ROJ8625_02350 [Roseivivax jejudonensis]|uniref:Cytochrome C oxidase subunit I n=1 Tax=Roseivivax jejudonensis TaxID=1529041 RepID=A0A1X6ZD62_9RHOB|nr:DUF2189 domain-containing protein [Roseivivax jejudonensis]SLN48310.1 hypothetical protein ROJ8625_02350 [Roseivivax jejudonensis]